MAGRPPRQWADIGRIEGAAERAAGRYSRGVSVLIGTESGLEGVGALDGRAVGPLAVDGAERWAIVDDREVWRGNGTWSCVSTWNGPPLTCLQLTGAGLLVGTRQGHLLRLAGDHLEVDASFDTQAGRDSWYTPWGAPADTRSIAALGDTVFVNAHVGGIVSREGDGPWRPLVDIHVDVHQVAAAPDGSLLAATGSAGFGRSTDRGSTWSWDHDGLHGSYCRAVAVAGDQVLLTASTGPHHTRGAVYRRPLGGEHQWQGVSEPVNGNIDTFWLAAAGDEAAFVTEDGTAWRSDDCGASWSRAGRYRLPRGLVIVPAN
jgi:hypothetical protein